MGGTALLGSAKPSRHSPFLVPVPIPKALSLLLPPAEEVGAPQGLDVLG